MLIPVTQFPALTFTRARVGLKNCFSSPVEDKSREDVQAVVVVFANCQVTRWTGSAYAQGAQRSGSAQLPLVAARAQCPDGCGTSGQKLSVLSLQRKRGDGEALLVNSLCTVRYMQS